MATTEQFNRKYSITNIRRGRDASSRPLPPNVLYAELRDDKGELVIAATLDYILRRINELA